MLVPSHWGNMFLVRGSETLVPLLRSAAATPCRPSHAGADHSSHSVIPIPMKIWTVLTTTTDVRNAPGGGGGG